MAFFDGKPKGFTHINVSSAFFVMGFGIHNWHSYQIASLQSCNALAWAVPKRPWHPKHRHWAEIVRGKPEGTERVESLRKEIINPNILRPGRQRYIYIYRYATCQWPYQCNSKKMYMYICMYSIYLMIMDTTLFFHMHTRLVYLYGLFLALYLKKVQSLRIMASKGASGMKCRCHGSSQEAEFYHSLERRAKVNS